MELELGVKFNNFRTLKFIKAKTSDELEFILRWIPMPIEILETFHDGSDYVSMVRGNYPISDRLLTDLRNRRNKNGKLS